LGGVWYTGGMTAAQVTPIMKWDDQEGFRDACVWWSRLDERWQIEVHRNSPTPPSYVGMLHIFDHNNGDKLVHSEPVGLSFEAIWGPDVADVQQWQERAIDFVDNLAKEKTP
jgi:hypothetical protein